MMDGRPSREDPLAALRKALDDISTLTTWRDGQVIIHDASAYNTLVGRIVMLTNGDYAALPSEPPIPDTEPLREALRRVFHEENQRNGSDCIHRNQHQSAWDCQRRADEVVAALGEEPHGR